MVVIFVALDQPDFVSIIRNRAYICQRIKIFRSVRVAERLALPILVHGIAGSNPTGGEILPEPKRRFIAQSLSCSPFHRLEMTEILFKGRKTLTHPSLKIFTETELQNQNPQVY